MLFTTQTCSVFLNTKLDLDEIFKWTNEEIVYKKYKTSSESDVKRPCFTSSMTMVIKPKLKSYQINAKISRNGTVQLTGCKSKTDAFDIFQMIWQTCKKPNVTSTIIWYMTNYNINVGQTIDKPSLSKKLRSAPFPVILKHEPFYSYPGVVFKIPLTTEELLGQEIVQIECRDEICKINTLRYSDYVDTLAEKDKIKKKQRHYISFLVFTSGKINVSGISPELTEEKMKLVVDFIALSFPIPVTSESQLV